jgi:hypothetical protein
MATDWTGNNGTEVRYLTSAQLSSALQEVVEGNRAGLEMFPEYSDVYPADCENDAKSIIYLRFEEKGKLAEESRRNLTRMLGSYKR